jgi:hypothetical protein
MSAVNQNEVSRDTVYEQLCIEMRRYRDYQMVITGWYTTLLLGTIAGLFSIRGTHIRFEGFWILAFGAFIAIVGGFIGYIIWYSHKRYQQLRELTDHKFPREKAPNKILDPSKPYVKPHHLLIAISSMLTVITILVLLMTTRVI